MKVSRVFLLAAVLLLAVAPSSPLLLKLKKKLHKLLKGSDSEEVCHTVYEDKTAPHCETTYEQVNGLWNLKVFNGLL